MIKASMTVEEEMNCFKVCESTNEVKDGEKSKNPEEKMSQEPSAEAKNKAGTDLEHKKDKVEEGDEAYNEYLGLNFGWLEQEEEECKVTIIDVWSSSEEEIEKETPNVWGDESSEEEEENRDYRKAEVNGTTRNGKIFHRPDSKKEKEPEEEEEVKAEDDLVLKQFKRTQAQASVWELLCSSEKH